MWTHFLHDAAIAGLVMPAPAEPYCPVCHNRGTHGPRCEDIGEPIRPSNYN